MTRPTVSYRLLLQRPAIAPLLGAAMVGRLAAGMVPFGAVAMFTTGGQPTYAGLAFATVLLVSAFTGPWRGRLTDRHSARTMLPVFAIAFTGLVSIAAALSTVAPALCLMALAVAAALAPPASAVLRTAWTAIAESAQENRALHSLDSVLEEATFVASPLLTSAAWALAGARWALVAGGAAALIGTALVLVSARRAGGRVRAAFVDKRCESSPLRTAPPPRFRSLLLTRDGVALLAPMFGLGIAMGAVAVVLPAWAGQYTTAEMSGVVLAVISAGGVLAGLVFGAVHFPGTPWAQYVTAAAVVTCGTALIAGTSHVAVTFLAATLIGLGMTPMFVVAFLLVGRVIPADRHTEANAALGSAYNLGSGGAAAAAGALLATTTTPVILILAATTTALTALAVALRSFRRVTALVSDPGRDPVHGDHSAARDPA
ncbi:MFS transporter [Pseudonocardia sp.]|uniref:MFS transporter n=1 Tax=Pseudonocardia sp. TaxID=60912 RepID=UPI0031FDF0C8